MKHSSFIRVVGGKGLMFVVDVMQYQQVYALSGAVSYKEKFSTATRI